MPAWWYGTMVQKFPSPPIFWEWPTQLNCCEEIQEKNHRWTFFSSLPFSRSSSEARRRSSFNSLSCCSIFLISSWIWASKEGEGACCCVEGDMGEEFWTVGCGFGGIGGFPYEELAPGGRLKRFCSFDAVGFGAFLYLSAESFQKKSGWYPAYMVSKASLYCAWSVTRGISFGTLRNGFSLKEYCKTHRVR